MPKVYNRQGILEGIVCQLKENCCGASSTCMPRKPNDARPMSRHASRVRKRQTVEVIRQMMCDIIPGFKFTTETDEDFDSGYISTLDTLMQMMRDGSISYIFSEKPMSYQFCMMAQVAISPQNNSLAMEVVRRLINTTVAVERDDLFFSYQLIIITFSFGLSFITFSSSPSTLGAVLFTLISSITLVSSLPSCFSFL